MVLAHMSTHTRTHAHTHTHTHTHAHAHTHTMPKYDFRRCEPKWIPFQFVNCVSRAKSKHTCNPCVPIRPCRCVICFGPDPNDSDDDTETVVDLKDGIWRCVCFKPPHDQVKEAELCVCSADTAAGDGTPSPESPLLAEVGTPDPNYGATGGKL